MSIKDFSATKIYETAWFAALYYQLATKWDMKTNFVRKVDCMCDANRLIFHIKMGLGDLGLNIGNR